MIVLLMLPALLGTKCIDYSPPADAGPGGDAGVDAASDTSVPDAAPDAEPDAEPDAAPDAVPDGMVMPTHTPEGMRRAACLARRCSSGDAVRYWKDDWDDFDVELTVTFRDADAATSSFEITDAAGPAELDFEVGVPVTLHLVAPGDGSATAAHDFTATPFFRTVAWHEIETTDGAYRAPNFDAILPIFEPGVEHRSTLRFIPIVEGSFQAWSSQGVAGGDAYADIVAGTSSPDFGTGDAGKGMLVPIGVAGGFDLTLFQDRDPDRQANLDSDARRVATDPVWGAAAVVTIGIDARESLDPETGDSVFTFDWTTRVLAQGVGHVLELTSQPDNDFRHNFTALGLLVDSVMRRVVDSQIELRASYLATTNVEPGARIQLWVLPTLATDYQTYCQIGVVHADNGAPDLTTGHAGAGMRDTITVTP